MAGNRSLGHPAAALLALFVILAGTLLVAAPAAGASNQETTAEFNTVSVITEGEFRVIPAEIWFSLTDSDGNVVWEGPAGEQEFVLASSGDPHTLTATARTDIGDFSVQMKSIVFDGPEYSRVELRFAYVWAMEGVAIAVPAFLALSLLRRIRMSLRGPRRGQAKGGKWFDYYIKHENCKNGNPANYKPPPNTEKTLAQLIPPRMRYSPTWGKKEFTPRVKVRLGKEGNAGATVKVRATFYFAKGGMSSGEVEWKKKPTAIFVSVKKHLNQHKVVKIEVNITPRGTDKDKNGNIIEDNNKNNHSAVIKIEYDDNGKPKKNSKYWIKLNEKIR